MSLDKNPYSLPIGVNDTVALTVNYRGLQPWDTGLVKNLEYSEETRTEIAVVEISGKHHYVPTKFLKVIPTLPKAPTVPDDLFE